MKEYVTRLTKDQIIERVAANSLPSNFKNRLVSHVCISKIKGDRIYLAYTGSMGLAKWQRPLRIDMTEEKNKTWLKCRFGPTLVETIVYIVFLGIFCFLAVRMGILESYYDIHEELTAVAFLFICGLLTMLYRDYGHRLIHYKRAEKVLEFVETVLEAKRL